MPDFVKQRSFELSYALFQLARLIKQKDLRERIEANAVFLLESSEQDNISLLSQSLAVSRKLVILGEGIGEVSYDHSRAINRQFTTLHSAIAEFINNRQKENAESVAVDLEAIFQGGFSDKLPPLVEQKRNFKNLTPSNMEATGKGESAIHIEVEVKKKMHDSSGLGNSQSIADRESAICGKIKHIAESGKECHLKDLVVAFPGVSERTLRYDLQRMCEGGVVERVGNGGPFSYYRLKKGEIPLLQPHPTSSLSGAL